MIVPVSCKLFIDSQGIVICYPNIELLFAHWWAFWDEGLLRPVRQQLVSSDDTLRNATIDWTIDLPNCSLSDRRASF